MNDVAPRKGDRVRVTFDADFLADDLGDRMVDVADGMGPIHIVLPAWATVEVLERADDPTIGEIRAVAPSADGKPKTAVKVGSRLSANPGARCMWVIVETGEMLADGDVSGLGDVTGAVPDSPAAKAQSPARPSVRVPNEPLGLSRRVRQLVLDAAIVDGKRTAAEVLRQHVSIAMPDAIAYVESMSEYQTYLAAHGEPVGEARTLHVHPHVWKSLVTYLENTRVRVVPVDDGTHVMELMDGEWPS